MCVCNTRTPQSGVADIAGGSGHVSLAFALAGVPSTVVDPRATVGCLPGRDQKVLRQALWQAAHEEVDRRCADARVHTTAAHDAATSAAVEDDVEINFANLFDSDERNAAPAGASDGGDAAPAGARDDGDAAPARASDDGHASLGVTSVSRFHTISPAVGVDEVDNSAGDDGADSTDGDAIVASVADGDANCDAECDVDDDADRSRSNARKRVSRQDARFAAAHAAETRTMVLDRGVMKRAKLCEQCGRQITWRKKWEKDWSSVRCVIAPCEPSACCHGCHMPDVFHA